MTCEKLSVVVFPALAIVAATLVLAVNAFAAGDSQPPALTGGHYDAPSCVPASAGLVSWWPGDGNGNDIAGTNNGTLQNGATFAPGEVGQAFSLSGGSYVDVPNAASLNLTQAISVQAWIQGSSFGKLSAVVKKIDASQVNGYAMEMRLGGIAFWVYLAQGSWVYAMSTTQLAPNTWYHVVGTYDGTQLRLYLNGVLEDTNNVSGTITASSGDLNIGRDPANPGVDYRFWNGLIDETQIYNRALTASEVAAIYDAGSAGVCKTSVAHGMDVSLKAGDVPDAVWQTAITNGIQVVIVNAWNGGSQGLRAKDQLVGDGKPSGTKGAQGNNLATGAYAALNYLNKSGEDNSGTYQIGQAVNAVGAGLGLLKFMAVDVEQCCGEFVSWAAKHHYARKDLIEDPSYHIQKVITAGTSGSSAPTSWNDSGGTTKDPADGSGVIWQDTGYTVIDAADLGAAQSQRLSRICEAIAAIPANLKLVIYTYKDIWDYIAGPGPCPAPYSNVDLSKVSLWDVEHGVVFKDQDGKEYCGDGPVGLNAFTPYGPWTFRSGDQYIWSNAVGKPQHWRCPGTQSFFGVSADLDLFSTDLLQ